MEGLFIKQSEAVATQRKYSSVLWKLVNIFSISGHDDVFIQQSDGRIVELLCWSALFLIGIMFVIDIHELISSPLIFEFTLNHSKNLL